MALDGLFINERWLLNAEASLLDYRGVDRSLTFEGAERIRTYALDEPYYWVKRVFYRIDPKDNSALTETNLADSILPFTTIVNEALAAGHVTFYKDLDYIGGDPMRGKEPIVAAPMILKVDFHLDTLAQRAVPHLVGLSVERPGVGYAHMYYPELSYALRKYRVRTKRGEISCDDYFRGFYFKGTGLPCDSVASEHACKPRQPSLEQQAELDALTELCLLERALERDAVIRKGKRTVLLDLLPFGPLKANVVFDQSGHLGKADLKKGERLVSSMHFSDGKPHGPYRAFYPDGNLREEGLFAAGLRQGKWNSWFPNRNIRSHRNYADGRLDGQQQVYHPNGQLWLEYGMAHGEYEGAHKTWYPEGDLKSSGTMSEGFISGEWDYSIRLSQLLMDELTRNNSALYRLPDGAWYDGLLDYHVTVTDNGQPGINSCLLGRCIQWEYSEIR